MLSTLGLALVTLGRTWAALGPSLAALGGHSAPKGSTRGPLHGAIARDRCAGNSVVEPYAASQKSTAKGQMPYAMGLKPYAASRKSTAKGKGPNAICHAMGLNRRQRTKCHISHGRALGLGAVGVWVIRCLVWDEGWGWECWVEGWCCRGLVAGFGLVVVGIRGCWVLGSRSWWSLRSGCWVLYGGENRI